MIRYWVYFPQGIRIIENNGTAFTRMMVARNKKHAEHLIRKYDGAYFERIVYRKDHKKFAIKHFVMDKELLYKSEKELFDLWNDVMFFSGKFPFSIYPQSTLFKFIPDFVQKDWLLGIKDILLFAIDYYNSDEATDGNYTPITQEYRSTNLSLIEKYLEEVNNRLEE